MPAIITDQIRVLNAENFVSGISTTTNSYYVFIGLPNATTVASDWNTNTPSPIDNFDEHDNKIRFGGPDLSISFLIAMFLIARGGGVLNFCSRPIVLRTWGFI